MITSDNKRLDTNLIINKKKINNNEIVISFPPLSVIDKI